MHEVYLILKLILILILMNLIRFLIMSSNKEIEKE